MPSQLIVLLIAAALVLLLGTSWWGARRLQQKHSRPAVAEPAVPVGHGPQAVALVLNPTKNNAEQARDLLQAACRAAGWEPPLILETTADDPGHAMVRQAVAAGADVVLAGGGDGTVRVVAGELAGTDVALGLLPLGTGNLLARNLDLDVSDLAGNIRAALHGHQRRIDTGIITLMNSATAAVRQDSFLVIAGIGVDAKIVADTKDELKRRVGWLAYSEAGVRNLPHRRRRLSISLDDGPVQTRKVQSVLFANCGLLPGGIDFIPAAVLDDGILDIVVMTPRSILGWFLMAGKVLFKGRRPIPVLHTYRARKVHITVAEPTETQLDGDPSGSITSLTVQVRPAALLVRVRPEEG